MKKIIFIIFFILAILYSSNVYAIEANETMKEQEEALGISGFIKEAENYTKDTFSDIDISSIYESAISGNIETKGIFNAIIKLAGTEVLNTLKILGYILVIIVIHGIIKSISDGIDNRSCW